MKYQFPKRSDLKKLGLWTISKISVKKRTASDKLCVVRLGFELGTAPMQAEEMPQYHPAFPLLAFDTHTGVKVGFLSPEREAHVST
jgi:hypothetical protein